jgi:repressor LexA
MGTARAARCLTARQQQVLDAIHDYRDSHGYPPSLREVAKAVGVNLSTVYRHVLALERKKRLLRAPGIPRALVTVDEEPARQTATRR